MTEAELHLVLDTWPHLPLAVHDLIAPVETAAQYQDALWLFEAVWEQVGETPDHPLGSLFVLLRDHITAYETRPQPVAVPSPAQVLAVLMEQQNMTTGELAVILNSDQPMVRKLLSGATPFKTTTIRALASYLHVNAEVFLISAMIPPLED